MIAGERGNMPLMADASDNPRVRFPPPLYYALAVVGGFFLNRVWPLPVGAGTIVTTLAAILCGAAVALAFSSFRVFRHAGTTVVPVRPATALVIAGPYRVTRNPMYLALGVLTIGLGLFLNSWWPTLLLVPVLLVIRLAVIAPEERYLHRRFGDEYEAYTRRVRRWF